MYSDGKIKKVFKVVYRRHTNFSVEPIQQTWNGAADFGRTVTCNINRNGDLITNMYVAVKLNATTDPNTWGFVKRLGHAMVESCKIEIGGSKIDEHYGDWLNIWYELTHKTGQERGYAKMIGDVPELTNITAEQNRPYQMYIPLQFWFNRNNGLALPLIALQYHDVRVTLKFRDFINCVNFVAPAPTGSGLMADSYLLIDYIYLDSEERKRFAQASHEYLIEQLQFTGSESLTAVTSKYRLNFNHPSKYLIWAPHLERYNTRSQWVAWSSGLSSWADARDRFARVLFVASRKGVTVTAGATGSIKVTANAGDLFEGEVRDGASTVLTALLAKIEVKMVAQETSATSVPIAAGADLLTELLNNTLVVRNNLSAEDISKTVAQLTALGVNTGVLEIATISAIDYFNYGNFVDGTDNPIVSAKLQLNGHDRFTDRDGAYFNYVQPAQHFSNTPADGINVYSFALKAEDHQPTGTCNFSRIDNATLQVKCGLYNGEANGYTDAFLGAASASLMNIYTQNYNVLRVMSKQNFRPSYSF